MLKKSPWPRVLFVFDGRIYRRCGYYGCQLESEEWRTVPAGTERTLDFTDGDSPLTFRVFSTERRGLKVRTTWALPSHGSLGEHQARIEGLFARLKRLV